MQTQYLLEMRNICKSFAGNQVLKNVSIAVRPGEILALVGENGAGKSTLMNILFGMAEIHSTGGFEGEILMDGAPVRIASPMDAMHLGIGMVHQEFMLIDGYEIAENVKLNRENLRPGLLRRILGDQAGVLDRKAMRADTKATLAQIGLDLDVTMQARQLSVGYKQFVEIARELDKTATRLIVLDEPTAVLTEDEAQKFLECVKDVSRRGIAIIFISHRLNEIKTYADRLVVLRDGELVGESDTGSISVEKISELIIGHTVELNENEEQRPPDPQIALELRHFAVQMPGEMLHDATVQIHKGEIFGFAGLAGHGKAAIANGIMGLYPTQGEVWLNGEKLDVRNALATLQKGVAFVSEDRRGVGLLLDESIETNIMISAMRVKNQFTKRRAGILFHDAKASRAFAREMIQRFDIRCTGPAQVVQRLSGGNQQKVCMARAVALQPRLFLVSEPTRGIDIGAKKRILDTLVACNRESDATVIVTSSELAELRSICDRIAIVSEGRIIGILHARDESYRFGMLMSGIRETTREETQA